MSVLIEFESFIHCNHAFGRRNHVFTFFLVLSGDLLNLLTVCIIGRLFVLLKFLSNTYPRREKFLIAHV